ncbi:MAG: flotillin family protein [Alphaproteobacteria bacterium]|nr:MAG: flotillin family protein [Alphaproteobacteria bacterium]
MLENITNIGLFAGIGLIGLLIIGLIFARLYTRASKEISFVRTGFGGQKVIMNGGALVFPVLHEVIPVNMNTLRLPVHRANEQALITRDRMRVDVVAEFYVRVQPTADAIGNAAQTLGTRTMQPEKLKDLVEGKFVDALRSVAAEMSMEELHEKRVEFVQKVQMAVSEDLLKNGLELETVSLTGLDQTGMEFFNPNNAFDAEGLTRLTEEIERRKKIRNDIEQDTAVQIKNKNLGAAKETLEIEREEEYARLAQQREVEVRRAAQAAEIAKEQADRQRDAEQAKIVAERAVEEERIEKERMIKERDIAKNRSVETQDIERRKAVELAEQERDIAISMKSKEQSEAAAVADAARATAVQAEERVTTARDTEVANRLKQIELIEAAKEAEREAIAIKIAAEAEKVAAIDAAEAVRERARGEADKARITAEAEAEAEKLRAAAAEIRYAVEATGTKALNEAANLLNSEQVALKVKLQLIENLESIIRESAKPMEAIDGIKIIQLDGLHGVATGAAGGEGVSVGEGNLADRVVSSALKYRAQAPLIDSLMAEVGLSGGDLNGLTKAFKGTVSPAEVVAADEAPAEKPAPKAAKAKPAPKAE